MINLKFFNIVLVLVFAATLSACSESQPPAAGAKAAVPTKTPAKAQAPTRWYTQAHVQRGATLYSQYCISCHGAEGQGTFNWKQRGANWKFPPPPLNGTAHTWHHPSRVLIKIIKEGTLAMQGSMPPWGQVLKDDDIAAVIASFQNKWPDPIYAAWYEREMKSRGQK